MRNLNIFVIKGSLNNNTKIDGNNMLHGLYKMEVVEYLISNGNTEPAREKIYKKRTIKARNRILNTSTALK